VYLHPVTLAVWIGLSSIFAHYMDWWPNSEYGIMSWLQVLPAFFAPAVPVMFFIDWYASSSPPFFGLDTLPFQHPLRALLFPFS